MKKRVLEPVLMATLRSALRGVNGVYSDNVRGHLP